MVSLINAWKLFSTNNKSLEEHHLLTTKAHYHKCHCDKTWTILFLYGIQCLEKTKNIVCLTSKITSSLQIIIFIITMTINNVPKVRIWGDVFNSSTTNIKRHPFKFKLLNILQSLPGVHTKNFDLLALYRISNSFAFESLVNKSFFIHNSVGLIKVMLSA